MPTPIATINDTTWDEGGAGAAAVPLRVRCYYQARPRGAFLAAEIALFAAVLTQVVMRHGTWDALILLASCGFFFHVKTLDRSIISSEPRSFWTDVLMAISFGTFAAIPLLYLFPATRPSLETALAGAGLAGLLPLALRPLFRQLFLHKKLSEGVMIVGTGDLVGKLYRTLSTGASWPQPERARAVEARNVLEIGGDMGVTVDAAELRQLARQQKIKRIVIAERNLRSRTNLAAALVDMRLRGIQVTDAVDFYEKSFGKIWVEALNSEWFVYTPGFSHARVTMFLKRAIDIVFSLALLVVTAPLWALIALAIKLDSPGPVLFRQERVGLHGVTFTIFKFRSMRQDAEQDGAVWAAESDPRVTRVGYWLRRFRLDEIPQAINVLRGEMSLVGPRPERPIFVERLAEQIPFYNLRHYVRPGITGWAQVMYRYGSSIEDAYKKLQYDFYYAKHLSLVCDLRILIKTVGIVVMGRGR